MRNFWEKETPVRVKTDRGTLEYFRDHERLTFSRPPWVDENGDERRGKTIVFDLHALFESGADTLKIARGVFADVLFRIDDRLELLTPGEIDLT